MMHLIRRSAGTEPGALNVDMCRTRPSSDRLDGGVERSLSCSAVRPAHFLRSSER